MKVLQKPSWSEFLGLCREAEELQREINSETWRLHGKVPSVTRAALVWFLAKREGLEVTINELWIIYGHTPQTLMSRVKLLREVRPELER